MKRNSQFRKDSKKHKDKLVMRYRKAVSLPFLCNIIENGGETFQIISLDKLSPPDSQNSSQQSISTDFKNNNLPIKKLKLRLAMEQKKLLWNRKNAQTWREEETMNKLKERSDSVCQVRISGIPAGSGFLLFGNFILTNAHVIQNHYNVESITIYFSFGGSCLEFMVEEVVGYENNPFEPPCDWALLRLIANENLPHCLLTHFGFLPKNGEIYITGHPDGGVKKIDSCLIVPTENRNQIVKRHEIEHPEKSLQEIQELFANMQISVQQQHITYYSDFHHGSSGSPVLDQHYNVVAMHCGGYQYKDPGTSEKKNVFAYGYALSDIMERMIIQMVEKGRFDVLKNFLTCGFVQCREVLINVKKLVDSRNLTTFKNVVNNLANETDTTLKAFFEFFSHVEAPVPMEIN